MRPRPVQQDAKVIDGTGAFTIFFFRDENTSH